MKSKISFSLTVVCFTALSQLATLPAAWAKVEFDSNQLMMKSGEEIGTIIRKKMKKAQDLQSQGKQDDDADVTPEPEAVEELKGAMRILLARPDNDGSRADLYSRLRRELQDYNVLEEVLEALAKEGISNLKSSGSKPQRQLTYIVLLENMMAELKPDLATNKTSKSIVEKIRDAKIEVSDKVKSQALLRSMSRPVSPSETASKILPKK